MFSRLGSLCPQLDLCCHAGLEVEEVALREAEAHRRKYQREYVDSKQERARFASLESGYHQLANYHWAGDLIIGSSRVLSA